MRIRLACIIFLFSIHLKAQIVNAYANVTAVITNTINVNNVDETAHTFEDGDYVILMQMQDNCIGSNTTNVSTFGDLASIQSAGLYEVLRISSHTETAGSPDVIVLTTNPINVYSIGTNSSLQLISFRLYGSPNYTTLANSAAKSWNGTTGGVLAMQVNGTLTLAHNLSASGNGFRGGAVSANYYSGGSGCSTTEYIRTSNHTRAGAKGESIYRTSNTDFLYARGHLLNGGGGGSERINCGGGGGGNYTDGGLGGVGWSCAGPGGGGLGGTELVSHISSSRVFMGGGGGGGQQNDGQGTAGGNGGGIIFLKANALLTQGACGGLRISANGNTVTGLSNDGQGGGGAAGSILIQTNAWGIAAGCQLTVSANGGNGGNVNTSTHAGGGGGAQGVVIYSTAQPTTNVVTQTSNGLAGCNNNSSPCTNSAGSPSGTNNTGTINTAGSPLPIKLSFFKANKNQEGGVDLIWQTLSERDNNYFEVERSTNGTDWDVVSQVKGHGSSDSIINYYTSDKFNFDGLVYYRLKQVDTDLSYSYSEIILVNSKFLGECNVELYPNPTNRDFYIMIEGLNGYEKIKVVIFSLIGTRIFEEVYFKDGKSSIIPVIPQPIMEHGIYLCLISTSQKTFCRKLIVSK